MMAGSGAPEGEVVASLCWVEATSKPPKSRPHRCLLPTTNEIFSVNQWYVVSRAQINGDWLEVRLLTWR